MSVRSGASFRSTGSKYSAVHAVVQSGPTVRGVKFPTARETAARRGEIFSRMTARDLLTLLRESDATPADSSPTQHDGPVVVVVHASASGSATGGTEEAESSPFTLLDVRPTDAFQVAHVGGALTLPLSAVHCDRLPFRLTRQRHREGHSVIVYSDSASAGEEVAHKLASTGYPHCFTVNGGWDAILHAVATASLAAGASGGPFRASHVLEGTDVEGALAAATGAAAAAAAAAMTSTAGARGSAASPSRSSGASVRSGVSASARSVGGSHVRIPGMGSSSTGTFGTSSRFAGIPEE